MTNVNNRANFEEVEAHCRLVSAKLSTLLQQHPAATSALEDLEDYYERQIQLRVMQNNTLGEQLQESKTLYAELWRSLLSCSIAVLSLIIAYYIALDPWGAYAFARSYWSYGAVAFTSYLVSRAAV